jgi:hypothetical protein
LEAALGTAFQFRQVPFDPIPPGELTVAAGGDSTTNVGAKQADEQMFLAVAILPQDIA